MADAAARGLPASPLIGALMPQARMQATAYSIADKRAANYLALVKLAAIRIWMRHNESVS